MTQFEDNYKFECNYYEIMNKLSYNSVDKSINLYDFSYIWLLNVKKIINLHCEKPTVKNFAKILHHLL